MRELPKIFISMTLTLVAVLSLLAFLFSGNKYDFLHSVTFLDGLSRHGLAFFEKSKNIESLGGSDYLPGLYGLLQMAILPGQILENLFNLRHCTIFADNVDKSCLIETVSLKGFTIILAVVWIALLQWIFRVKNEMYHGKQSVTSSIIDPYKFFDKSILYLLSLPPIFYSIFLFGAYDGLGAFITLIGGLLYFNSSVLVGHKYWPQMIVSLFGLILASIGVSAKFFPFVLLLGTCIIFSRKWKDSLVGIGVPVILTLGQIWIVQSSGGNPLRILQSKAETDSSLLLYPKFIGFILLLLYFIVVIYARRTSGNRLALGGLVPLGIFSILFPSIFWHPQWQIYYGISLAASWIALAPKGRMAKILLILLVLQALTFIFATQYWYTIADITMSFAMLRKEMVPYLSSSIMPAISRAIFRQQSVGLALQFSWITYSLTQILILILLAISFLRADRLESQSLKYSTHGSLYRPYFLIPGVVFILSWYGLVFVSIFLKHASLRG
jgi:hypothetical protein